MQTVTDVICIKEGKSLNIKEWLNRARRTEEILQTLESEKEYTRNLIFSGQNVDYKSLIAKYFDYEKQIDTEIDKLVDIKKEVLSVIGQIEDIRSKQLLTLRYLEYNTWDAVSEKMNYDLRWIHRKLHPQALRDAERIRGSM